MPCSQQLLDFLRSQKKVSHLAGSLALPCAHLLAALETRTPCAVPALLDAWSQPVPACPQTRSAPPAHPELTPATPVPTRSPLPLLPLQGGETLLLSQRVNSVQKLRHTLLKADRVLEKHEDEVGLGPGGSGGRG